MAAGQLRMPRTTRAHQYSFCCIGFVTVGHRDPTSKSLGQQKGPPGGGGTPLTAKMWLPRGRAECRLWQLPPSRAFLCLRSVLVNPYPPQDEFPPAPNTSPRAHFDNYPAGDPTPFRGINVKLNPTIRVLSNNCRHVVPTRYPICLRPLLYRVLTRPPSTPDSVNTQLLALPNV